MAAADTHVEDFEMENDSDEDDENAWEELEEDVTSSEVLCLFSQQMHPSPDDLFTHCRLHHRLDMLNFGKVWGLDSIQFIKFVNYVRIQKPKPEELLNLPLNSKPPWDSDAFMIPHDPEDVLLQYDIEDLLESGEHDRTEPQNILNGQGGDAGNHDAYQELCDRLVIAEKRASQAQEQNQQLIQDLEKMRLVTKDLVMSSEPVQNPVQSLTEDEDDAYFSSYSHYSIHADMLKDRVRTESYRDFMCKNEDLFRDKVVLDVGCGTGILSMFAAKAGAKLVIGVDQSEIVYQAMDIVRENGYADKITLLKGRIEDVELPVPEVDIIVSEWMGYFLLFESMLDSVLYARDMHLKKDGIVFPDKWTISLAASCDPEIYSKHVTFWEDVYGFRMNCMKSEVVREALVEDVRAEKLVSEPVVVKELDVCSCSIKELEFNTEFQLVAAQDAQITAVIGYFDIFFDKGCQTKISFSTSPSHTSTHWKQTVFVLANPLKVNKDEVLSGRIKCRKNRKNPRGLTITLTLKNITQTYQME